MLMLRKYCDILGIKTIRLATSHVGILDKET
jgi:hypothetical protein